MSGLAELFPGFAARSFDDTEGRIFARVGGTGPGLLLLHGYPQTHATWHRVAGELARHFTVVAADLRGYGRSGVPPTDGEHRPYSKRVMAAELAALMAAHGFNSFRVMGHDRGGSAAYRMALDLPDAVERVVLIETVSTLDLWENMDIVRKRVSHWPLLAQPAPIPESLIGRDPVGWLEARLRRGTATKSLDPFEAAALDDYRTAILDPDRIHAMCEDHRAGAHCDIDDDRTERATGRRIACPGLAVFASEGLSADLCDPTAFWKPWFHRPISATIQAGHFVAEENPHGLLAETLPFLLGETS
jgi:haloacetate dehalogenase